MAEWADSIVAQSRVHQYNRDLFIFKEDIMKRFQHYILLVPIFVLACGSIPGLSATATPTLEPTLTPLPTKTPTSIPTATPNAAATKVAQATQNAGGVLGELDKLLDDTDIPYKDGYLAWEYKEPIVVSLTGPDQQIQALNEKLKGNNFILKSDVTWSATGIILCGAIFRSEPDLGAGKQYQLLFLRLSGLPGWTIDVSEFGKFKNSITKTQFSSALHQENGATNQFVLIAQDEQFTVYINHIRQGRFFDNSKQLKEGNLALFGFQDSGKGSCEFENSWIWSLEPPPPGGVVIGLRQ
jgi:hypothetical protein